VELPRQIPNGATRFRDDNLGQMDEPPEE